MKKFQLINKQSHKEFKPQPNQIQKRFANELNGIAKNKYLFSKIKHLINYVGMGVIATEAFL